MSNPSAMKYGGYDENHRVGNEMKYLNSFPSFRPSRTYNPYLQNDSSTFFDHQTTLAQLTSFVYQLSATVGSLSHENSILLQTTRQLLVDNELLKLQVEQSDLAIKEISRASLPGGHWVWEAGYRGEERIGRWVWSGHKYKQIVPQPADGLPVASLESMPVELFNEIASLLPRSALLALCGVSPRLLELASSLIYRKGGIKLGTEEAVLFVNARTATACSNRIRSQLLPHILKLSAKEFNWKLLALSLNRAPTLGPPLPPIQITSLHIDPANIPTSLFQWAPILALLNPREIHYNYGNAARDVVPSIVLVEEDHLWFLPSWTRLERFVGDGVSSVPVTPDGTFAFLEALKRGGGPGKNVEMSVMWGLKEEGGWWRRLIAVSEVATYLSKPKKLKSRLPADRLDTYFVAALV